MELFYEWFNMVDANLTEGRGGLLAPDRWLQQMTTHVPQVKKFRARAAVNRRMYYRLYQLSLPEVADFRSMRDVDGEVFTAVNSSLRSRGRRIPRQRYMTALKELIEKSKKLHPPAPVFNLVINAYLAHQYYLEAAVDYMAGLIEIFKWIGKEAGKEALEIKDLYRHSRMRMEVIQGYGGGSVEEKNLLQGIFICALAVAHGALSIEEANEYLKATVESIMWAMISTNIHGGWTAYDVEATAHFTEVFSEVYGPAAIYLETKRFVERHAFGVPAIDDKSPRVWWPCSFYVLDRETWLTGLREITPESFKPMKEFKYGSTGTRPGITLILGKQGVGKTTAKNTIIRSAVEDGAIVIAPRSDERNQASLYCLRELGLTKEGRAVEAFLLDKPRVKPHGIPTMIVSVTRPSDREALSRFPLTKFDRVIVRRGPNFHIDFDELFKEAQRVHDMFPQPKPRGMAIVFRYLGREEESGASNYEQLVGGSVIMNLRRWRQTHTRIPVIFDLDELQDLLPRSSTRGEAASDTSAIAGQLLKALKHTRGFNFGAIANTQWAVDVVQNWLSTAQIVMIKGLPQDQVNFLFEKKQGQQSLLPLHDDERMIVRQLAAEDSWIMGTDEYRPPLWLMYDRAKAECELVWVVPEPMYHEQPRIDVTDAIREIEKVTKEDILVPWKEFERDWGKYEICKEKEEESTPAGPGRLAELADQIPMATEEATEATEEEEKETPGEAEVDEEHEADGKENGTSEDSGV
jgi:hypothetical protein